MSVWAWLFYIFQGGQNINTIDNFLKNYEVNRYDIAKISGVGQSTLADANKRPASKLTVKVLQALAMGTGRTPGEVLDALLKAEGNPVIRFIEAHPYMDKQLVQEVQNLMIKAHENHITLKNITFNRYYDEGPDTNENAEIAMKNLASELKRFIKLKNEEDKKSWKF